MVKQKRSRKQATPTPDALFTQLARKQITLTKEIPLTKGKVALVDEIDADLADIKWYPRYSTRIRGYYVQRHIPIGSPEHASPHIHREVLGRILGRPLLASEYADHINHDTLDNRRCNLRLASRCQNMHNQGKRVTNKSGYKGVSCKKNSQRWSAQIMANGIRKHIGYFSSPEDAARAYDAAARELHGEFAYQNFPETINRMIYLPFTDSGAFWDLFAYGVIDFDDYVALSDHYFPVRASQANAYPPLIWWLGITAIVKVGEYEWKPAAANVANGVKHTEELAA